VNALILVGPRLSESADIRRWSIGEDRSSQVQRDHVTRLYPEASQLVRDLPSHGLTLSKPNAA
jgi:hypothetical protein